MSTYTKYFGLLLVSGSAALSAAPAHASISNIADELYSETIYIEKSSAEIPAALESNGRGSEDLASAAASADLPADTTSDMVEAPSPKKLAKHRRAKK